MGTQPSARVEAVFRGFQEAGATERSALRTGPARTNRSGRLRSARTSLTASAGRVAKTEAAGHGQLSHGMARSPRRTQPRRYWWVVGLLPDQVLR